MNLLVIDNNLYYSKNLIIENNPQNRIYKILTNGEEALNTITNKSEKIDIILLDLKILKYNGIELLEEMKTRTI